MIKQKIGIVAFNKRKHFVAYYKTLTACARYMGLTKTAIYMACVGKLISAKGLYFRYLLNITDISDLERMNLIEYDKFCNVNRKIYKTTSFKKSKITTTNNIEL